MCTCLQQGLEIAWKAPNGNIPHRDIYPQTQRSELVGPVRKMLPLDNQPYEMLRTRNEQRHFLAYNFLN